MDKNELLQGDSYSVFVPIEDHDLMKSIDVDENGDFIVQGVMTSDDQDEEDDSISPEGMDCSYFLEKGWIKYEHGKNPDQFIGEPLEVKVGRFEHPTLMKAVNGVFVKGRLFANRKLTQQAIDAMQDLQKSHTKRRMGWSIEGSVKERNKAGKIVKSVLRNVVLTMNPVNTTTWAELAKSFAKDHEMWIDMDESVDKSMDLSGAQAIATQSLEGAKKKDPQDEWIEHFRSFVKKALINKSFRNEFVSSSYDAEILAFSEMLSKGLSYEDADGFASYIASKHALLKSLVINFGGENMSKEAEVKLASLLDADLEELQKSLEMEDDEALLNEDDELEKAIDPDQDGDDDQDDEGHDDDQDDDEKDDDDQEDDGDDEGDEDDEEEDDDDQKGGKSKLSKSLATDHGQGKAFEVSDFLTAISDEIGFSLEGIEKSMMGVTKQQGTLIKAISTMGEMMKSFESKIESLQEENEALSKSLNDIMERPVGRKGVVNQREVQTLSKSLNDGQQPKRLNKEQITDELVKSFAAGEIAGSVVSRFEAGVPLNQLKLPDHVRNRIFGQ